LVDLGPGQKPVVMPRYPHMMPEDTDVWTKFLRSNFIDIKRVWYDVRVGLSVLRGVGIDSGLTRIANGITRKRIDVVAAVGGGLWVVEVKPWANMYALGQVLTYLRLFRKEYISPGEVIPVIVCDGTDDDILEEIEEFGVLVIQND